MISWLLAFVLLFVGFMVGEPHGSGMIDPALVAFVIFFDSLCADLLFRGNFRNFGHCPRTTLGVCQRVAKLDRHDCARFFPFGEFDALDTQ